MPEKVSIRIANSNSDLKQIFDIRRKVFVEEQKVDEEEEYDAFEEESTHLIANLGEQPVGTCRYRTTDKGIKLERFAVLKDARGANVGKSLVVGCLENIDTNQYIYLHAQIQVVDFYKKYGFVAEGPLFVEANIKHYKMVYNPTST